MSSLDITRSYANGDPLLEADLDSIQTDVKTFFNVTKTNDDNFQTNAITASSKIISGSVSTAKIAANAVTSSKIASSAITTAKIADGAVDSAALNDAAITAVKLASSSVTNAKITSLAITPAKRESIGQQTSTAVNYSTTSSSEVDVTNATLSITTTGKPVMIWVQKSTTTAGSSLSLPIINSDVIYKVYRGVTVVATFNLREYFIGSTSDYGTTAQFINNGLTVLDFPSAGTYTYKLTVQNSGGGSVATSVENSYLTAMELF